MRAVILAIIIFPVAAMAGNPVQKSKRNSTQKKFDALVGRLSGIPGGKCLSTEVASSFEVPEHWECRVGQIEESSTTDKLNHNVNLLVETNPAATEKGPRRLVFITMKWAADRKSVEYYQFISDLDGELMRVLETHSKRDEKGQSVRSSAIDIPQDIKAKETQSRFKHELEFWLDGKYRKKQKKS